MSKTIIHNLHRPTLEDIKKILEKELCSHFSHVSVDVVDCPNLTKEPFHLAAEGLCGKTTLADVGGVPYLIPLVQKNRRYNLKDVAKEAEIDNAFMIGAGAGPCHHLGVNSEMMPNIKFGEIEINNTHIAKINKNGDYVLEKLKGCTDSCVLCNLFLSEGKAGKVLNINVSKRLSSDNFVSIIRKILANHYKDQPVGIGGVFLIKKGKAKLHVMPDFSRTPLNTDDDVDKWLRYFNMSAPLICLSTFISHDPGLDLRVEHTHCFSCHGDGGHYHYDVTPDEVEYDAYFNIAERIVRIDAPEVTHQIGRD